MNIIHSKINEIGWSAHESGRGSWADIPWENGGWYLMQICPKRQKQASSQQSLSDHESALYVCLVCRVIRENRGRGTWLRVWLEIYPLIVMICSVIVCCLNPPFLWYYSWILHQTIIWYINSLWKWSVTHIARTAAASRLHRLVIWIA